MNRFSFEPSAELPAPPEAFYAVLSDYGQGQHAIFPEQYFEGMAGLEGIKGPGTKCGSPHGCLRFMPGLHL